MSSGKSFLEDELSEIPSGLSQIPHTQLITCHPSMVQVRIRQTEYKEVLVYAQFSSAYPSEPLLLELKSKTISEHFIDGLMKVCDQELKKNLHQKQVLSLVRFVCDFISNNPFIVCADELSFIKKELLRDGDVLKVKQKTGVLHYKAFQHRYFLEFTLAVPHEYPTKHVKFEIKGSNMPQDFMVVFAGHTAELCRQCVEPPLRRKPSDPPFHPRPSLQLVANYLISECIRRYPLEKCPLCHNTALPEDPKDIMTDESHGQFVYRVYCGHLYHRSCLEEYMKTPPFEGGKKCPKCKQRIFHDKWNVQPRLAEERWAHQEARRREIAEVADFLGFS